ncbi:MAG: Rid family detoxifying hydrolase [Natronomonas sp.]|jgi:reactive intermediate/imine deaminase|uniref:RidA family protein n=1 Tax=Natronomonas salsuginis TaxID=2217661 RepID=A0A4U5J6Z4_9EURY|nr:MULTISPECIES: Rid family detoxifying hydrolase [Natronomonas]MDR9381364.1 Rid family detoxifying hydrolase [Natronomonas sp.]MDR9429379.1 Rid family detoxifying hydrolase [Natronomonas sp.]TKR24792.1 RidA family protein [Natronomonas salsuginis]
MGKETIHTDDAPPAAGAYSQATTDGGLIFTAGQVALTPDGDSLADECVEVQTERALDNLAAVLEAAGSGLDNVLKTTVFLADIDDFDAMNEVYGGYFDAEPPARSAVQAGGLPLGMAVEIEAVATRS